VFCFNVDNFEWSEVLLVFPGLVLTLLSLLAGRYSAAVLVVIVIMSLGKKMIHSTLLYCTFPFSGILSPTYSVHKVNLTDFKINAA
jgi:uncharacterized membrane protein